MKLTLMILSLALISQTASASELVCEGSGSNGYSVTVKIMEGTTSIPPSVNAEVIQSSPAGLYAPIAISRLKVKETEDTIRYSSRQNRFSLTMNRESELDALPPIYSAVLKLDGRRVKVSCTK